MTYKTQIQDETILGVKTFNDMLTMSGGFDISGTQIIQIAVGTGQMSNNGGNGYTQVAFNSPVADTNKVAVFAIPMGGGTSGLSLYTICYGGMLDAYQARVSLALGNGVNFCYLMVEWV